MPLATTGERIRAVRDLLGITQEQLAAGSGVSQSLISSIEKARREATPDVVAAIAAATAMPKSFFEITPRDIPTGSLRHRKRATASVTVTKQAEQLAREAFRVTVEEAIDGGITAPKLPLAREDDLTGDAIEQLAEATREALLLQADSPVPHLIRACERAGIVVVPLTLPGSSDHAEEAIGHFGNSLWRSIDEPAFIGYFTGGPGDLQRFTVAHELGHLVLHTYRRHVPEKQSEEEAHRFAGALLMSRDRAEDSLSSDITLRQLAQIKRVWGISMQALIMRGAHLGVISEPRRTSLFKQLSARGWRRNEPVAVHNEEPALMWKLLAAHHGEPVNFTRISEPLGLSAHMLRSFVPVPAQRYQKTAPDVLPLERKRR